VSAVEPAQIAFGRDGFLFRRFLVATDGQEVSASGYFSPAGVSDLTIGISGFLASDQGSHCNKVKREWSGGDRSTRH